jgi:hypothetical protein
LAPAALTPEGPGKIGRAQGAAFASLTLFLVHRRPVF